MAHLEWWQNKEKKSRNIRISTRSGTGKAESHRL